jgi:hypothetical protein
VVGRLHQSKALQQFDTQPCAESEFLWIPKICQEHSQLSFGIDSLFYPKSHASRDEAPVPTRAAGESTVRTEFRLLDRRFLALPYT